MPRLTLADPPPQHWSRLLGRDRKLRARVAQMLLAIGLGAGASLIFSVATWRSKAPTGWVLAVLMLAALQAIAGYVLVRSRWSERLADPSMTGAQMGGAILLGCVAYPLMGSQRAAVIPLLVLVLAFGMFPLRGATSFLMALLALAGITTAVGFSHFVWPRVFDPIDELAHAGTAAVAFLGMAVVAGRLQAIRQRLTAQRTQLHRALGKIESLARHDALTGLYNRGEGDAMLRAALARHRRNGTTLQVALIDLDHFKKINDDHSHAAGDAVLRAFAQQAQAALRGTDAIARWGGEEFLVLLDDTDPVAARMVLERLLAQVKAQPVMVAGQPLHYSFSAGMAQAWPHDRAEEAVDRADRALYRAKQAGRARVMVE
jgi:diguanylate cyclase (GGDEF)-like protein